MALPELLNELCLSTRPKIKFHNNVFPNAWVFLAEFFASLEEQGCTCNVVVLTDLLHTLVNSSQITKALFLSRAEDCAHISGGSVVKTIKPLRSKIHNALDRSGIVRLERLLKKIKGPSPRSIKTPIQVPTNDELFPTFGEMSRQTKSLHALLSDLGVHNCPGSRRMNLSGDVSDYLARNNLSGKKPT